MNIKKINRLLIAITIIIIATFFIYGYYLWNSNMQITRCCNKIKSVVIERLIYYKHLSSEIKETNDETTILYVLGGNQGDLKNRYRIVSDLYKKGLAKNIFILDRPGITAYSPILGRNLTNNEWSVRELENLGIKKDDIKFASIPAGFFGTLREAKAISRIAKSKGCKRLILVSSDYHTRRVYLTFSHFMGETLEIFIYESHDSTGLYDLLVEYGKYILYRSILIPVMRWGKTEEQEISKTADNEHRFRGHGITIS